MKKNWFSSKELTTIEGLPSTTQGVNRKARLEKWRCRQRQGVQGKSYEYHIDSLPQFVRNHVTLGGLSETSALTDTQRNTIWLSSYLQLTPQEQKRLLSWLFRYGFHELLILIDRHEKELNP